MKKLMLSLVAACAAAVGFAGAVSEYRGLPEGYTQVETLTSSGKQVINLGFKPDNKTSVECVFRLGSVANSTAMFGQNWNGGCYLLNVQGGRFCFHGGGATLDNPALANTDYLFRITPDKEADGKNIHLCSGLTEDGFSITNGYNETLGVVDKNLFLFGRDGGNYAVMTLYSMKVWKDGALIRDLVPALKDDEPGLYNLASDGAEFYVNALTGENFAAGSAVPLPYDPLLPRLDKLTTSVTLESVVFSGTVAAIGEDATSVDIYLAYAQHGSALPAPTKVKAAIGLGDFSYELGGLTSGTVYDYELTVINTEGRQVAFSGIACPAPAVSLLTTDIWISGLQQARFNAAFEESKGVADSTIPVEVTPGPVMADLLVSSDGEAATVSYKNPYTGTKYYYYSQNTTFAYFGWIWLEANKKINFTKNIDDNGLIKIDGKEVLRDTNWQGYPVKSFTPDATGWYPIELRAGDGSGGKGPSGGKVGKSMGFGYNIDGTTSPATEGWSLIRDAGNDMKFLKTTAPGNRSMMGMGTVDVVGDDAKVWFVFKGVPGAAQLRAYYDSEDRGEDPAQWSRYEVIADIPAGDTPTMLYTATDAAKNGAVRFALVVAGTDAVQYQYQFSPPISFTQVDPSVSIQVDDVQYVYADVTAKVNAFGIGASSVQVSVFIANNGEMEGATPADLGSLTSLGSLSHRFDGLDTNATYYVQARAVNNKGGTAWSKVESLLTLSPALPSGSFSIAGIENDSMKFSVVASDCGGGSTTCRAWVELSKTADFSDVVETVDQGEFDLGNLDVAQQVEAKGLEAGTLYYTRLVLCNTWGLYFRSGVQPFVTRQDIVTSGIGYESIPEGLAVTVGISYFAGDSVQVELYAGGNKVGQETVSAPGEVKFLVANMLSSVDLRAVVTGGSTSIETNVRAVRGSRRVAIAAIADHATPQTAVLLGVGDALALPPVSSAESYALLNGRFATFDSEGPTVTARVPGVVGVEYHGPDGSVVATLCILVLPKDADSNRVFVHAAGANWSDAATWRKLDGSTPSNDYPHLADDIAYIVPSSDLALTWSADVSMGQIYVGCHENKNVNVTLGANGSYPMTLARSRGNSALIQLCPNNLLNTWTFQMGNKATTFTCGSDVLLDFGWNQTGETSADWGRNVAKLKFNNATVDIPKDRKFLLNGDTPYGWGGFNQSDIDTSNSRLTGAGTFAHAGRGPMSFLLDASAFTGTIVEAGGPHSGGHDRSRNMMMFTDKLGSSSLILAGYPVRNDYKNFDTAKSVSYFGSGAWHGWGSHGQIGNRLPPAGLILRGGFGEFVQEQQDWGASVQSNYTARMTLDRGFTYLAVSGNMDAGGYPYNFFQADAIVSVEGGCGTLYINESNCANGTVDSYRSGVFFPSFNSDAGAYGDGSDCMESETYSIRPNMVSRYKKDDGYDLMFASVTTGGRVVRPKRTSRLLSDSNDPTLNAYADYSSQQSTKLNGDVTVNSLVLHNRYSANLNLGEGNTLTILSGGLILNDTKSAVGGLDAQGDAGSLVFGDTAYVWATSFDKGMPNTIAAKMTAPKGFVSAMPGYLQIVGDQTGIDGSIVVNGGTFYLGAANGNEGVTIDVPVQVAAGATLSVRTANVLKDQPIYMDAINGNSGRIELSNGNTEKCLKLYVRDSVLGEDAWTTLPRGTYTATTHPGLITGDGTLVVRKDDLARGMYLIVK